MVTTSGPKPSDQDLYMKVKEKVKKKILRPRCQNFEASTMSN